ncbi:MAG TPA: hypothetical protein PLL66_08905 [Bacteroidales bacterium]|nr:hypothetical protein [Bacteroidales bacterium]
MKTFFISCIFVFVLLFSNSCRIKDNCELQHTGSIYVTNNTGSDIEVYVDNQEVFSLTNGESKSTDKPVGTYTVKCLSYPDEWSYEAIVEECDSYEITVPE